MIFKNLTEEQRIAYLAASVGTCERRCPYCGSGDVVVCQDVECKSEKAMHTLICENCCREWADTYTLSAVDDLEQPCNWCDKLLKDNDEVGNDRGGLAHAACLEKANAAEALNAKKFRQGA